MSLVPARSDFRFVPGTDLPLTFTLTDGSAPVNLTLDSVVFTVTDENGSVLYRMTNAPGGHTDATNGVTAFTLTHDHTKWWAKNNLWSYSVKRIVAGTNQEFVYIIGELLGM